MIIKHIKAEFWGSDLWGTPTSKGIRMNDYSQTHQNNKVEYKGP